MLGPPRNHNKRKVPYVLKAHKLAAFAFALQLLLAPAFQASAQEPVDLAIMTRIRDEGFNNSKVMETMAYLTDVIGPRLTASPQAKQANDWTRTQLEQWGLANAHLEAWGPFGRGWSYDRASVVMVAPSQTPLMAIPEAWTPATNGPVRGKVVRVARMPESEAELAPYKGKLAGAILLVGEARRLEPLAKGLSHRYTDTELDDIERFDIPAERRRFDREAWAARARFRRVVNQFLVDEKALAVVESSPWDRGVIRVGGSGVYRKDEPAGVPTVVMAAEHFNRIARLVDRKMDVELEVDVRAAFHDADPMGYNTIAEIPGGDKRDEVVMIGAHLDSWHSGTGATDNAAGCAVVMEAVRILRSLGVKPRRTIRVALWTGEEQGLYGSRAYVAEHFATRPEPTDPEQKALPVFMRRGPAGPLTLKPQHGKLSAYFNLDNGTGRIRGIYAEGNAAAAPIFASWLAPFADLGATTVTMRSTGGTDHQSFDGVGLPGFQFIQDEVEYSDFEGKGLTHHSNMDVYDRAQRADLMQASVIMAAFLYNAAMRSEMLPRKPLPVERP
jgi:hypothetical protein